MSEKISGVCKVWRGEYSFLVVDDGEPCFCITANASAAVFQPPKASDKLKFEIERRRKG